MLQSKLIGTSRSSRGAIENPRLPTPPPLPSSRQRLRPAGMFLWPPVHCALIITQVDTLSDAADKCALAKVVQERTSP